MFCFLSLLKFILIIKKNKKKCKFKACAAVQCVMPALVRFYYIQTRIHLASNSLTLLHAAKDYMSSGRCSKCNAVTGQNFLFFFLFQGLRIFFLFYVAKV